MTPKLHVDACHDSKFSLSITLLNTATSQALPMPDHAYVLLSASGWTEVALPSGCPQPLPPGTACAIPADDKWSFTLSLVGIAELLLVETYGRVRLTWDASSIADAEAATPTVC